MLWPVIDFIKCSLRCVNCHCHLSRGSVVTWESVETELLVVSIKFTWCCCLAKCVIKADVERRRRPVRASPVDYRARARRRHHALSSSASTSASDNLPATLINSVSSMQHQTHIYYRSSVPTCTICLLALVPVDGTPYVSGIQCTIVCMLPFIKYVNEIKFDSLLLINTNERQRSSFVPTSLFTK